MNEKVCVIGAGSSGITAVKALKEAGVPFDCFEMGTSIGGNWRYNNDNGRSAAYDSLCIDTSKERMAYSDFPMPEEFPNFPHHTQVLAYFEQYADHFDLRRHVTCRTQVRRVVPLTNGGYDVTMTFLDSGESRTQQYRAVLVCNGHHWNPNMPEFPGTFDGETLHSRAYRQADHFAGKNVLVVGIGNSGVDLACDIAPLARQVFVSTRRSAHIIPRFILGRPTDKWVTEQGSRLPFGLQRLLYRILLYLEVGDQEKYGVPKPEHPLLSEHPTMSAEFLDVVASGAIKMKPNVARLEGSQVHFTDGSAEAVDTIIYATGYKVTFPFLDEEVFSASGNELNLYRYVVDPDHKGLYFIGFIQPLGAIMPLAELQARWVAALLSGDMILPARESMLQRIEEDRRALQSRYVPSPRHTMQVDFYPYKRLLLREMEEGRAAARMKDI